MSTQAAQRGADGVGGQAAVGEQHLDQGAGAGLVAEPAAGQRPEPFVVDAERARGAGPGQRGGAGQGARLDPQHLQVVVQHQ